MNTTTERRPDDENKKAPWRISGKLLTLGIVVLLLAAIALAWSFSGGDTDSGRAEVHGEITIDDTPVESGFIHFISLEAKTTMNADAPIEKGKYQIPREEGPGIGLCKVVIRVRKKTGQRIAQVMGAEGEFQDEVVEGAAERFNAKSTLTFDVQRGTNTANFTVSAH